jgi:hypothetical protein
MASGLTLMVLLLALLLPHAADGQPVDTTTAPTPTGNSDRSPGVSFTNASGKQAADAFAAGQEQYNAGDFRRAIASFTRANRLRPHPATLFNIARCHENLGEREAALRVYALALGGSISAGLRGDVLARVQRLKTLPVRVFVTTVPQGARLTVDGRARPEPKTTPSVVELSPGEHVLLLQLDGYELAAKRIVVGTDGAQHAVQATLQRPAVRLATEVIREAPDLVRPDRLRVHITLGGALMVAKSWGLLAGPGFEATATIKRIHFGGQVLFFPIEESREDTSVPVEKLFIVQAEGGYAFTFRYFYLATTAGLGGYIHRRTQEAPKEKETDPTVTTSTEVTGFAWSVGATVEAMLTEWLSVGAKARFGMMHGVRLGETTADTAGGKILPYGVFWGTISFHL